MTESERERMKEIRRLHSGNCQCPVCDVPWLLSQLESREEEIARLKDECFDLQEMLVEQGTIIFTLRAAVARAREALEPFAKVGNILEGYPEDDRPGDQNEFDDWHCATFGDCRRAASVHKELGEI